MTKPKKNNGGRRPRRKFTPESKEGAVRLVLEEGKTVNAIAKELDLAASALRLWVECQRRRYQKLRCRLAQVLDELIGALFAHVDALGAHTDLTRVPKL